MDDFQFTFTWQDTDYKAEAEVKGDPPRQKFFITVDDEALQTKFGTPLEFSYTGQDTFTWDIPDIDQASEYLRSVNLGLLEYLDENE